MLFRALAVCICNRCCWGGRKYTTQSRFPASAVVGFAESVLALEGDPAFGEYLSGDCVTCHQVSGNADGIPSIIGIPKDYFVRALFEYKNNIRQNEVMKSRVVNLSNEEIAALAAYFETLKPQ